MIYHQFKIEVSETEMEAFLTIIAKDGNMDVAKENMPDIDQVIRYLDNSGIKFGINEKAIARIIKEQKIGQTFQVAKGERPTAGQNGYVEYNFRTETPDGNGDMLKSFSIESSGKQSRYVTKGDLLAKVSPPSDGSDGSTITGRTLKASGLGGEVYIVAGRNTYFSDDSDQELRASKNGLASLFGHTINIDGSYLIEGNVDESIGDIEFPGDIIILRDVKNGLKIESGGKIEVHGNVEDAHLIAGGDIIIKGDYIGAGEGELLATDDIHLRSIENQSAKAGGSIHILRDCIKSNLTAGDSIVLNYGEGRVKGGNLKASWGITAGVIGLNKDAPATLELTKSGDLDSFINKADWQVNMLNRELREIATEIQDLKKYGVTEFGKELNIPEKLRELHAQDKEKRVKLSDLGKKLELVREKQRKFGKFGQVHIRSKVSSGTRIIIEDAEYIADHAMRETVFLSSEGSIKAISR